MTFLYHTVDTSFLPLVQHGPSCWRLEYICLVMVTIVVFFSTVYEFYHALNKLWGGHLAWLGVLLRLHWSGVDCLH